MSTRLRMEGNGSADPASCFGDFQKRVPSFISAGPLGDINGSASVHLSGFGKMLDRIGLGYVVLDEDKAIIGWNYVAKAALDIRGEPGDLRKEITFAFKQLLSQAKCQISPATLCWIVIPHLGGRPVVVQEACDSIRDNQSVVFLLARDTRPKPNRLWLQKLFGLTGAETEVALSIACGQTLLEIAQNRNLSRTTVRSHLAALFAKTDTRRQSDLMALLINMAVLP